MCSQSVTPRGEEIGRKQSRELGSNEQGFGNQLSAAKQRNYSSWGLWPSRIGVRFNAKTDCPSGKFSLAKPIHPIRSRSLEVEMIDLSALRPYVKNARRHSRAQIKQIAKKH